MPWNGWCPERTAWCMCLRRRRASCQCKCPGWSGMRGWSAGQGRSGRGWIRSPGTCSSQERHLVCDDGKPPAWSSAGCKTPRSRTSVQPPWRCPPSARPCSNHPASDWPSTPSRTPLPVRPGPRSTCSWHSPLQLPCCLWLSMTTWWWVICIIDGNVKVKNFPKWALSSSKSKFCCWLKYCYNVEYFNVIAIFAPKISKYCWETCSNRCNILSYSNNSTKSKNCYVNLKGPNVEKINVN